MKNEIKAILFGRQIALRLIHDNPGVQMVFTERTIGDQCFELAYLRAYQRYNHYKKVAVVSSDDKHVLFRYFRDEYDGLITISKEKQDVLIKFYKSDLGQIFRKNHPELFLAFSTAYVRSDLLAYHPYLKISQIQKANYRIPQDTMPCQIAEISQTGWLRELEEKDIIRHRRTVILNPCANTCEAPPDIFFEKIAEKLKSLGFKVVTSVYGKQKAVKGTYGLKFSADKLIALANECGYIIGTRSGFMDLVSFSEAIVVSIDDESYPFAGPFRLEDCWPQNPHIRSFMYKKENEATLVVDIAEYIKEPIRH